jgi:ribose 1,5-bisphosphate isomerase
MSERTPTADHAIPDEIYAAIEKMRADREGGASQLARASAEVLKEYAKKSAAEHPQEFMSELRYVGKRIEEAKPMGAIPNAAAFIVYHVHSRAKDADTETLRKITVEEADSFISGSLSAVHYIAEHGAGLIAGRVLTHSWSSTVIEIFKKAKENRNNFEVIATESRPGEYGKKVRAALDKAGIPSKLILDSEAGAVMRKIDKVLVGADSILANGALINAVGTSQIAYAAKNSGVPFYVASEILKVDARSKEKAEGWFEIPEEKGDVIIYHFDKTEPRYITSVITERGLLSPTTVGDWAAENRKYIEILGPD